MFLFTGSKRDQERWWRC